MLDQLGIDSTTELVYRAMLAHPDLGVLDLATKAGLTEEVVRSGLDRLSELSLVRPSYETDGQLRAVGPERGMELLLARQQEDLAALQHQVERSRAAAARLIADCADLRPASKSPEVEQLVGLDRIRERLAELTRNVRSEVMTFAAGGPQTADNLEASKPLDRELLGRGVQLRVLYLDAVRNSQPSVDYATWFGELGGQVRTLPSLPVRMIIVDRELAVVPTDGQSSGKGAVVLYGDGTVTALCALFDTLWAGAAPFGNVPARDLRGLTAQEAEVLRLLGRGLTDEAIAKRLGVSPRTARRAAADLMSLLNARSRFEAGARAAQNGWLTLEPLGSSAV
ncbi:helix-turn-helix transcriptional regulator [Streptomyces sp. SID3343]|uniref:helix-turn-helix domain-containing protein n=1 Tax=Streptomyces sp. SID3343 TaxID=2690260 RepID=UPI001368A816|nr:helix-turn-helix transcriptional regulator [Streptomyces sp. SID3343]MYW02987.1 helix-turn-helix transcriptional regulator [Streptomyces sp. SID3343]